MAKTNRYEDTKLAKAYCWYVTEENKIIGNAYFQPGKQTGYTIPVLVKKKICPLDLTYFDMPNGIRNEHFR